MMENRNIILIIDDSKENIAAARLLFADQTKFQLLLAMTLEEGLALLAKHHENILAVLSDMSMPRPETMNNKKFRELYNSQGGLIPAGMTMQTAATAYHIPMFAILSGQVGHGVESFFVGTQQALLEHYLKIPNPRLTDQTFCWIVDDRDLGIWLKKNDTKFLTLQEMEAHSQSSGWNYEEQERLSSLANKHKDEPDGGKFYNDWVKYYDLNPIINYTFVKDWRRLFQRLCEHYQSYLASHPHVKSSSNNMTASL